MINADDDSRTLIGRLKLSHQTLTDSISQIQLVLRSYNQAKPKLRELYRNLHDHFAIQEPRFYERLSQRFADDRQSAKMLEFLTHDLKDFKIKYLIFSDQHPAEMIGGSPRMFPLEFTEFAKAILSRITMEEDYLFPLVEKLSVRS